MKTAKPYFGFARKRIIIPGLVLFGVHAATVGKTTKTGYILHGVRT